MNDPKKSTHGAAKVTADESPTEAPVEFADSEETSEVFIYRIFQELCNNITKHAEAKKVLVQFIRSDEELHILVEDDGKGFDLNTAMKKEGIGLNSLISRINFLNGKYEIDSRVGEGERASHRQQRRSRSWESRCRRSARR